MSEEPVESFLLFDLQTANYRNMTIFTLLPDLPPISARFTSRLIAFFSLFLCIKYSYFYQ